MTAINCTHLYNYMICQRFDGAHNNKWNFYVVPALLTFSAQVAKKSLNNALGIEAVSHL